MVINGSEANIIMRETNVDFDIVNIGYMRWTQFYGETVQSKEICQAYCTTTLVRNKEFNIIIDPPIERRKEDFLFNLRRQSGLKESDIDYCFFTHHHFDHIAGIDYFGDNVIYVAHKHAIYKLQQINPKLQYQNMETMDIKGIKFSSLAGHTVDSAGLSFELNGKLFLVAGDAVMTKNHFFTELTNETVAEYDVMIGRSLISKIKKDYDFIVPGHGGIIINNR